MKKIALITALALLSGPVLAESWTSWDHNTGSMYRNHRDDSGTTTYGTNMNTGSSWRMRQNNDGTYSGTDSEGNYFRGDHNTGSYMNLGTGVTCYGTGYARTCN